MSPTELAIRRPLLMTMVFGILILFGTISYFSLNHELLPKFDTGVISISTTNAGASPTDIQNNISKPIEDAISTVEGLDYITSKSRQNLSTITLQLKSGVDDKQTQLDVERLINQIKSTLPSSADAPIVSRFSSDQFPILNLALGAHISESDFDHLLQKSILPALSNVPGVGQVTLFGNNPRQIQINLHDDKMLQYKISPSQVMALLNANLNSMPGGQIANQGQSILIRVDADINQCKTLEQLVLRQSPNGSTLYLKDIASISDAHPDPKTINRNNGISSVGLQIFKTNDANSVQVSAGVKAKLAELKQNYRHLDFKVDIASDQSIYTLNAADGVIEDLGMAILIVGAVMLLFLHSFRSSIFVLIAIPSAIIPTFIAMSIFDFSLNMMTLMAMSLVVGILVDDSIVVLENIFRHLEMGKSRVMAAIEGRNEIGYTAIAITLVDIVVFVPMALTTGLIGNIVRQFALVVVFSTLMSLFVSFTLTPMLVAHFGKLEILKPNRPWTQIFILFENMLKKIQTLYLQILIPCLQHRKKVIGTILVLIGLSLSLVPTGFIGSSFLGNGDRGQLSIKLELSPDMPFYQTNLAVQKVEALLLQHSEVSNVYTLVGTQTGVMGNVSSPNLAEIDLSLVDKQLRNISTDAFSMIIRNELQKIPGIMATVVPMSITGASNSPIQIVVSGPDLDSVSLAAQQIKSILSHTAGTDYVQLSTKSPSRQIRISPDRLKLAEQGLTVQDLTQMVNLSFSGNDKQNFKDQDNNDPINLTLDPMDKRDLEQVQNLSLSNKNGQIIRLRQVALAQSIVTPTILERTNRMPSITVTSSAVGRPSGTIVHEIQDQIQKQKLAEGVNLRFLGDAKNQKEAFSSLAFALGIALILVYMIMVALYESLVDPFVVIFSVPVATIGALLALALTMNQLTIITIIGMIMLLGLVTKNGILIVDFANAELKAGKSAIDALVAAGQERLRPIMMTTLAMILGMLPLAISQSAGSEIKNGMAWVLIGGLSSSFLLTLILVPCVYLVFHQVRQKRKQKKSLGNALSTAPNDS